MCVPSPSLNECLHPPTRVYFESDFTYCLSMNVVRKRAGELSPLRLHLIFLPDELTASQRDSLSSDLTGSLCRLLSNTPGVKCQCLLFNPCFIPGLYFNRGDETALQMSLQIYILSLFNSLSVLCESQ